MNIKKLFLNLRKFERYSSQGFSDLISVIHVRFQGNILGDKLRFFKKANTLRTYRNVKLLFLLCFVLLLLLFIIDIRQSIEILIFFIDNEEISVFDIMQSIETLLFDNFQEWESFKFNLIQFPYLILSSTQKF